MAYDINDLVVVPYLKTDTPTLGGQDGPEMTKLKVYLAEELRKLEKTIATLNKATPQVAFKEPQKPMRGMIRYAVSPWDPLGTGDAWVWWDGSNWVALP